MEWGSTAFQIQGNIPFMIQRLVVFVLFTSFLTLFQMSAVPAQQASERLAVSLESAEDRADVARTIETAHAVADVLGRQIGELEDFRRREPGYMLRDGTGGRFILPEDAVDGIAASLGLDIWMNDPASVRDRLQQRAKIGSDLDRAMAVAQTALFEQIYGPGASANIDFANLNSFLTQFVRATLIVMDENNRGDLSLQIEDMQAELSRVRTLLENAEFRLVEIERAAEGAQVADTEIEDVEDAESADEAPDWRTVMAERGAELPVGASLIDPTPTMDKVCNAPTQTPIWILVSDGGVCSDPWAHRGSGSYDGKNGDWCVWCPANMWWRSGWGCCFPD